MKRKIKIVLVDDNKEFCMLFEDYLSEHEEFEMVGIAYNGVQAIDLLKREKDIDVLLLDIVMPHLDGLGVMEEMNKLNLNKGIITIILSAFGQEEVTKKVVELGANFYIMKPFDMEKLLNRIRNLFNHLAFSKVNGEEYRASSLIRKTNGKKQENLAIKITEVLHNLGIPAHIKGYIYLKDAIEMVINNFELLSGVTTKLYPAIANLHNSKANRVERAIRHAINISYKRSNEDVFSKYFGHKPTNSQFIARISDKLRIEQDL